MKKWSLIIFLVVALTHLLFEIIPFENGIYFSKPLLIPTLFLFFWQHISKPLYSFDKIIILALVFSCLGDILLLPSSSGASISFVVGLGSFLVAHLGYIYAFYTYPPKQFRSNFWISGVLLVLAVCLILFLWDSIESELRPPVLLYAITICTMGIFAYGMFYKTNKQAGMLFLYGALLFILSDSMIAINKFRPDFEILMPNLSIMLTYILAQFLIMRGAIIASKLLKAS